MLEGDQQIGVAPQPNRHSDTTLVEAVERPVGVAQLDILVAAHPSLRGQ
jgi:hypothetical protein